MEVWAGVTPNMPDAAVEVWQEVGFRINCLVAQSREARTWLRREAYKSFYDDAARWETHYKLIRRIPASRRPESVARGVSAALTRTSEKLARMLETSFR
jgi:hypothetical protein